MSISSTPAPNGVSMLYACDRCGKTIDWDFNFYCNAYRRDDKSQMREGDMIQFCGAQCMLQWLAEQDCSEMYDLIDLPYIWTERVYEVLQGMADYFEAAKKNKPTSIGGASECVGSLESRVAAEISKVPEVDSVYVASDAYCAKFYVFTTEKHYDDALMDRLLNAEIAVRQSEERFATLDHGDSPWLDFRYIPLVLGNPSEVIPKYGVRLFKREAAQAAS